MKIKGTVLMNFEIELDVDDISENSMTMYESDLLIVEVLKKEISSKLDIEGDINVISTHK